MLGFEKKKSYVLFIQIVSVSAAANDMAGFVIVAICTTRNKTVYIHICNYFTVEVI